MKVLLELNVDRISPYYTALKKICMKNGAEHTWKYVKT